MEAKTSILKTICFFELFDYPLTLEEIHYYLWEYSSSLDNVRKNIRKMISKELGRKGEFYFLKGQEKIVQIRREREKISQKKWRKAKRISWFLQKVPYIRMIAVCNSLAINNAKEESDIDIFIISKKNRLWIVRFLVTKFLKFFGQLQQRNNKKDLICPSFYVTEEKLSLRNLIRNSDDFYLYYWISQLKPVFGRKIYKNFIKDNDWVKEKLINMRESKFKIKNYSITQRLFELIISPFSNILEKKFKRTELQNILKAKKEKVFMEENLSNRGKKEVIANNFMVKLYDPDKREFYNNKFKEKLKKYEDTLYNSISSS